MAHRIEVLSRINDSRAKILKSKLESYNFKLKELLLVDVYTINKQFSNKELIRSANLLINPVIEDALIDKSVDIGDFDWAVEIGFLPGVTDNIASTVKEEAQDLLKVNFDDKDGIYSSLLVFVKAELDKKKITELSLVLYNPLIQSAKIKKRAEYIKTGGMGITLPIVHLDEDKIVTRVNLDITDNELTKLGKQGILNPDGSRRGPLALDLTSMQVIKEYFKKQGRIPFLISQSPMVFRLKPLVWCRKRQ